MSHQSDGNGTGDEPSELASLRDEIAGLQTRNAELMELAQNDPLTGVLNRRGIGSALERENERALRSNAPNAAVLLDLDDFKRVNDTFGHDVGDAVLRAVADALLALVRPTDYVSRLGGDEYLVLLCEVRHDEAVAVAERLRSAVAATAVQAGSATVTVTCSIGWTVVDERGDVDGLVKLTSEALKRAKAMGKDVINEGGTTPPSLGSAPPGTWREATQHLRRLVERLRTGVAIRVLGQPIIDLSGAEPQVVAYELLARGPRGAFRMPDAFFKLSVENELSSEVDLACLREAIRVWSTSPLRERHRLHVNVMPQTLLARGPETVMDLLAPLRDASGCTIEVSEKRIVGSPTPLVGPLETLAASGVSIALDSFGLSRNALEALLLLSPQLVKCEVKQVRGCDTDAGKRRTLQRLVTIAERTGATLVAVGVETAAELGVLRELGIDRVQGYLFGEPSELVDLDP